MASLTYGKRPPLNHRKIREMRKTLLRTMYLDLQLFGYPTESVKSLAAQIRREKQSLREAA